MNREGICLVGMGLAASPPAQKDYAIYLYLILLNTCSGTNSAGQQRNKTPTDFKRELAQCLNAASGHRNCKKSFVIPSAGDPSQIPPGNKARRHLGGVVSP